MSAAKISDVFPVAGVALPQLRTTWLAGNEE
jgi:hypothetical protein